MMDELSKNVSVTVTDRHTTTFKYAMNKEMNVGDFSAKVKQFSITDRQGTAQESKLRLRVVHPALQSIWNTINLHMTMSKSSNKKKGYKWGSNIVFIKSSEDKKYKFSTRLAYSNHWSLSLINFYHNDVFSYASEVVMPLKSKENVSIDRLACAGSIQYADTKLTTRYVYKDDITSRDQTPFGKLILSQSKTFRTLGLPKQSSSLRHLIGWELHVSPFDFGYEYALKSEVHSKKWDITMKYTSKNKWTQTFRYGFSRMSAYLDVDVDLNKGQADYGYSFSFGG